MKYLIRINTRVRNVRIYSILKKTSGNVNFLTKLFMRVFAGVKKEEKLKI